MNRPPTKPSEPTRPRDLTEDSFRKRVSLPDEQYEELYGLEYNDLRPTLEEMYPDHDVVIGFKKIYDDYGDLRDGEIALDIELFRRTTEEERAEIGDRYAREMQRYAARIAEYPAQLAEYEVKLAEFNEAEKVRTRALRDVERFIRNGGDPSTIRFGEPS